MSKIIVKGIGIGFLSCIGIGIAKTISQVLVLVLLRRFPKVLVMVLGRNFGIAHLCNGDPQRHDPR